MHTESVHISNQENFQEQPFSSEVKSLHSELIAAKSQIKSLQDRVRETEDDLSRDEQIFAAKMVEMDKLRYQILELQRQNASLAEALDKERCESSQNSFSKNAESDLGRPVSQSQMREVHSPNMFAENEDDLVELGEDSFVVHQLDEEPANDQDNESQVFHLCSSVTLLFIILVLLPFCFISFSTLFYSLLLLFKNYFIIHFLLLILPILLFLNIFFF